MADDITTTATSPAGPPDGTKVVTDEHPTRGHMQVVKLAYSADGDATYATLDSSGLLVKVGTAAGSIAKAEDAAHASGDVGVGMLTVRADTAAATAGTDGDYQFAVSADDGSVYTRPTGLPKLTPQEDGIRAGRLLSVWYDTSENQYTEQSVEVSQTGDGAIIAAGGAGNAIRVTGGVLQTNGALTFTIRDGSGGTILASFDVTGMFGWTVDEGDFGTGTDNTALYLDVSAGSAGLFGVLKYVLL